MTRMKTAANTVYYAVVLERRELIFIFASATSYTQTLAASSGKIKHTKAIF